MLVNSNTASAAEIVAACLQDHQRAVVVGERTFGQGVVRSLIPLKEGVGTLKLPSDAVLAVATALPAIPVMVTVALEITAPV